MHSSTRLVFVVLLSTMRLFAADAKITTVKHLSGAAPPGSIPWVEQTVYVQGMVERQESAFYADASAVPREQPVPHVAWISHCDTEIGYEVDFDAREYREFKMQKYPSQHEVEKEVAEAKKEAEKNKHNLTLDKGETKDFHGYTARHLVTNITVKTKFIAYEETVDGWYLDSAPPGCAPEYVRRNLRQETVIPVVVVGGGLSPGVLSPLQLAITDPYAGIIPGGLAIQQKIIHRSANKSSGSGAANESTVEQQVIDFSEAPLDPTLFEVPPGFTKVKELHKHSSTPKK